MTREKFWLWGLNGLVAQAPKDKPPFVDARGTPTRPDVQVGVCRPTEEPKR